MNRLPARRIAVDGRVRSQPVLNKWKLSKLSTPAMKMEEYQYQRDAALDLLDSLLGSYVPAEVMRRSSVMLEQLRRTER